MKAYFRSFELLLDYLDAPLADHLASIKLTPDIYLTDWCASTLVTDL